MNQHAGSTTSLWMQTEEIPKRAPLDKNTEAEVCIVGAGISGLTTGYMLAREGRSVVILDDGPIGGGETERTTAHLSNALDDGYYWLEKVHGLEGSVKAAQSHTVAIALIESICFAENIQCDLERLDGYLFLPPGVPLEELTREFEAAHRARLFAVEEVERAPIPSFDTGRALRFPRQAQFHPLAYLRRLAEAIERRGGRIFADTRATGMQGGRPATVETSGGFQVHCGSVVVATNSPVNDLVTMHTKQAPYRSYVVGFPVPAGAIPRALYWDTAQDASEQRKGHRASYHYVRLQKAPVGQPGTGSTEILMVGGEDHKTGQADDSEQRWQRLEAWTRERFPMCGKRQFWWSGQVMEPVDGLAFIGRNPGDAENVYIATGDSGHGMTHGTIAGILLTDLINGRPNEWADLYDPARITPSSALEFARENLNVAKEYTDYLTGGDVANVSDLAPDCGAVIRKGATKMAVYRDEAGAVHEFSAVCPHLKCIVHWNSTEKTWDCPCHGSRFTRYGEVINGPALTGLQALHQEKAGKDH